MSNKFIHLIASVLSFGIPLILASHSTFLDLSVGTILNGLYLFVSQIVKPTVPISQA